MDRFSLPRWSKALLWCLLIIGIAAVIFRLGNQASAGVTLNDPVVWVEDGARGRVLQINGSTQEVTASVRVGDNGDSIRVLPQGQNAVFLNRTSGEIGVIGAVSLGIDNATALTDDNELPLASPSLELHADFDVSTDAFVLASDRIVIVEPAAGSMRSTLRLGDGLGSRAVDSEGNLIAVTTDAMQIAATQDLNLIALTDLPTPIQDGQPPGIARAGEAAYVVDASRRTVNEITNDGGLGPTTCVAGSLNDVKIGGNHTSSSTGLHRILVHDAAAGILSVSEPSSSDCLQIPIDDRSDAEQWGPPVAVDEVAYIPNYGRGLIHVVDLEEQIVLDSLRFGSGGRPFELEVFDGAVWANEPQGSLAALLERDDITQISKISAIRVAESADGEGEGFQGIASEEDVDERIFGSEGAFGFGSVGEEVGGGGDEAQSAEADSVGAPTDDGEAVFDDEIANAPVILDTESLPPEDQQLDELIANFVFSADTINVGETVEFTDTSTGDPVSWNWEFGDGTGDSGPEVSKIWETEGIYTVTLFVSNEAGEEASQSFDFTVIAPDLLRIPTADFAFRSATIEVGEVIEFTDQSTGDPETLLWSFGDGSTAAGPEVSHSYAAPGQYTVTLTASNEAGPNTTSAVITVIEAESPPEAIIGPFPGVVEVGQTVTLTSESTNSPTAVSWGFDDGDSALGTTVRHSWSRPGTYRIRLSVSNSAGASETFSDIVVEPRVDPPVARFSESSLEVVAGTPINFTDLSLNSPTSISWEFGDNTTGQGANVSHTWDDPGTYTVTLTVQNEAGTDDTAKTVTILRPPPNPPTANFTFASATIPVNSVANFTDTSTGDPTEWSWDFGDGSSSTAQNPPHSFSAPGEYTVTLTASNAGGSDTVSKTIVVVDPPIASFTSSADELEVTFDDTSVNSPTAWSWDFGDGTSSTQQNPVKTYASPGQYTVTLTATNEGGTSAPFTANVLVLRRPTADFNVTTGALTAQFTDASTGAPTAWSWDFGDGTTSTVQNPTHTYASAGTYTVELTASNAAGSSVTSAAVTVMNAPPEADISCQVVGAGVACDASGSTGASTYAWSAPSSIASNGTSTPNASFTYDTSGSFTITVTVTNANNVSDSASETVTVNVPEPPTITSLNVVSNTNGVVELSATASNSPTSWSWSAPGGTISGGSTSSPTITYTTSGQKTVTVTASNGVGTSNADDVTFTVSLPSPPVITAVGELSNSGGTVVLSPTASNSPTSWSWTMSSPGVTPSTSASGTPTFNVTANGTYSGTVTATNADGTSAPFPFSFTVTDIANPPVISSVSTTANSGGTVVLDAVASNSPTSWSWTISTGGVSPGSSTAENPTFNVTANGTYGGTVTATNGDGTSAAFPFSFTVTDLPTAPVVTSVNNSVAGVGQIQVSGTATNSPTAWSWSITGSNEGTLAGASPTFSFPANGTYNGTATASNGAGSSAPFAFSVTVSNVPVPPPVAGFTWSQLGNQPVIIFTNTSTAQAGATYVYSFGDPGASQTGGTNDSPRVTYSGPGTYTVQLTVTDAGGSDSFSTSVVVAP